MGVGLQCLRTPLDVQHCWVKRGQDDSGRAGHVGPTGEYLQGIDRGPFAVKTDCVP